MARLYWEFLLLIYGEEEQNLLNNLVGELLHRTPQAGRHMVQGALRSRGLRIQRERFRDAIIRVTSTLRTAKRVVRIRYSVPCPNAAGCGTGQVDLYEILTEKGRMKY